MCLLLLQFSDSITILYSNCNTVKPQLTAPRFTINLNLPRVIPFANYSLIFAHDKFDYISDNLRFLKIKHF